MNAKDFAHALRFQVPKKIQARAGEVYLDSALQAYEAIARDTPVDTGFLRASLGASSMGQGSGPLSQERDPKQQYAAQDSEAAQAVNVGVKNMAPITMGFRAKYAQHVEDRVHMVKSVLRRWPTILRDAVRNAS